MFSNTHRLTVEWGDCDPAGIVFYPRFFAMFDVATAALMEAAAGMNRAELIRRHNILGWPMVSAQADFRAPVSFDDLIDIGTTVERIGTSSLTFRHELRRGAELCVTSVETRVWAAHGQAGRRLSPQPIPPVLRDRLMAEPVGREG
jgi:4-hydroxybenzoyl-CoA thioesterase